MTKIFFISSCFSSESLSERHAELDSASLNIKEMAGQARHDD